MVGDSKAIAKAARAYLIARYVMLRDRYYDADLNALSDLIDAEADLWEALTGERGLIDAAKAAGVRMVGPDVEKGIRSAFRDEATTIPIAEFKKRMKAVDAKAKVARVRYKEPGLFS